MAVTVRIDPTRCRGHAICAVFLRDAVDLDAWGFGRVVDATVDSDRTARKARRAAAACPNRAILVTGVTPVAIRPDRG